MSRAAAPLRPHTRPLFQGCQHRSHRPLEKSHWPCHILSQFCKEQILFLELELAFGFLLCWRLSAVRVCIPISHFCTGYVQPWDDSLKFAQLHALTKKTATQQSIPISASVGSPRDFHYRTCPTSRHQCHHARPFALLHETQPKNVHKSIIMGNPPNKSRRPHRNVPLTSMLGACKTNII
ncbi:hypothetical protein BDV95DRAFT_161316 [Massariosphaeria phaeospora]|uniref:Uncharacterized protein n=1 Tax=Massariosphaeria phaeospora TaxID=100035 RepID=A0A7C8MAJ9_9PLEO|nr:hypothetical protein BDV95DRAFT_161316 [Massariosphaeria phaeospora]